VSEVDYVRRRMSLGELVPSEFPRDFTISIGSASRPPQVGDIWLLAGEPYLVSEVSRKNSAWGGKLRYLTEALPTGTEAAEELG